MAGSFYTREVGVLTEVSVTEQVLREISKFPEILGKLSMRKQCVPGSFLPAHAREPGNEANTVPSEVRRYPAVTQATHYMFYLFHLSALVTKICWPSSLPL